jgi:holin-like protein
VELAFVTLLLVCQLAGEVIAVATGVPIPGPVIGMALLFFGLALHGAVPDGLRDTAGGLLKHLALLFVPAGVGIMAHLTLLADEGWPILAALVGGTVITIAVTAGVMRGVSRLSGGKPTE